MGCLCCCSRRQCCCSSHEPQQQEKPTQPRTCCESFAWHLREFRSIYMIAATLIIMGGVGLLVAGVVMFVDPSNRSTVSDEYFKYLQNHDAEESRVIRATTITTNAGVVVPPVQELIPFRFVADAKGTETRAMVLTDTYWTTSIPRPLLSTFSVTIRTDVLWQGRRIATDSITLPTVPTTNASQYLSEACLVIERTSSLEYVKSSTYDSCFYPSTAGSQRYVSAPTSSNITLSFRSGFSPYVTMLQRFGKGDLNNVRDEEVLTSSTPLTLLGVGIAAIVLGFMAFFFFCCCVRRQENDMVTGPKYV